MALAVSGPRTTPPVDSHQEQERERDEADHEDRTE
ncbi:MAG: hypothetical protein ACI9PP_000391 [Halobacteriales archaeon]|jgi:hypothetical protein